MKKIFEKIKGFFGKLGKKKTIAIIVILVITIFVVVSSIRTKKELEKAASIRSGSVETIETRAIANSISGTGVIDSEDSEEVITNFKGYAGNGLKVTEVFVDIGDVVNPGDKICQFETEDLIEQKEDQEKQLTKLQKRRNDTAEDWVEKDEDYDKQIVKAEKNRKKNGDKCIENYNKTQQKLAQAQIDLYEAAGTFVNNPTELNRKNMETKRDAVDAYEDQLEGYAEQFETLWENDEAEELRKNKADYDESTAESIQDLDDSIEDATDSLNDTKSNIAACTVKCTTAGTITSINVKKNFSFNGTVVAIVEGVNTMMVKAEIDEYDIADVEPGMKVLVRTDSTRDVELAGVVKSIAPRATGTGENDMSGFSNFAAGMDFSSIGGTSKKSATYQVKITGLEQNERLRLGMNCKVSILTKEEEEAISVPFDALQTDDDGNYFIEIVTSGEAPEDPDFETKKVKVKVGIEGSYYVEVISDEVKEGMKVFVPSSGNSTTLDDLLTNMGSDAGV